MFLVEWSQLHKSCLWLRGREGKERLAFLYSTLLSLPALNHLLSEAPSGRVPFPSNESPTSLHLTISISQCFPTSQDGSRGLGMSSLKPEDAVSDYSTLDEAQMKTLNDWVSSFISFFFFWNLWTLEFRIWEVREQNQNHRETSRVSSWLSLIADLSSLLSFLQICGSLDFVDQVAFFTKVSKGYWIKRAWVGSCLNNVWKLTFDFLLLSTLLSLKSTYSDTTSLAN